MLIPVARGGGVEQLDLVPSKIIGIGVNYRAHAVEMGKGLPEEPLMFLKPRSAMIPDGGAIERPAGYERVDYEGELGVVIGQRAKRISREQALSVVMGFTCINDVTVRDLQKKDGQWSRAKGFDTFCPIGPRIVAGLDPSNLRITHPRQRGCQAGLVDRGSDLRRADADRVRQRAHDARGRRRDLDRHAVRGRQPRARRCRARSRSRASAS